MKHLFRYMAMAAMALTLLASCSDDENSSEGAPVISASTPEGALFGDSIKINVACSDQQGVALSTLKAQLCYGEEVVAEQTIRTKTEGNYTVSLYAPYYKDIPNGTAEVRMVLQNIRLATTSSTVEVALSRPEYQYITLVSSTGTEFKLQPDASDPYMFRGTVQSDSRTILGYIKTPAASSINTAQTFGQGTQGVTQGVTDNLTFASTKAGEFEVYFNVKTYEYGPQSEIPIITLEDADGANTYVGELTQNGVYEIQGSDKFSSSSWYYDPDFFKNNGDGTYTFLALTGIYTIKADFTNNGFKVWGMADTENTGSLASDGTGYLWIIGSDCIGKPGYQQISGQGWWTDTDHALCLAPISSKVYQITLTIGQQLKASAGDINFKFFGQAGWGTEFKGTAADYYLSTDSSVFAVGDGSTEYAGGHDNGNIYLQNGVTLTEGETYVLTVDLSAGCSDGKLTVTKK